MQRNHKVRNCTTCMAEYCDSKDYFIKPEEVCASWVGSGMMQLEKKDMVNHPSHYAGQIEVIDYIRDKLTPEGFTEYCCGNVLKYISRWRKKDGIQDLKKAKVYLEWMIDAAEKERESRL